MRSPFLDPAAFLCERFDAVGRQSSAGIRLLAFALVTAVAASSAVLIAL
jgi:hypothetical protein